MIISPARVLASKLQRQDGGGGGKRGGRWMRRDGWGGVDKRRADRVLAPSGGFSWYNY